MIIGNGPSLNQMAIERLGSEITIGCNGLFLLFSKMGFIPTYYTVEDVLVAEDRGEQIAQIIGSQKIIPFDLRKQVPDPNAVWINFIRHYKHFPQLSLDLAHNAYWGGTVTFLNLQLAIFLGCNPIYLIGVDHNYKTDIKVEKDGARWMSLEDDKNHFDPNYFGKGYRWHDPQTARMELAYQKARSEAERLGVSIFNATHGGKLEVFPRVDFDSIFQTA